MNIAIMQPYLFPYLSYFQLMQAVDLFVVYDDVNYINRGWINRNNILLQGQKFLFTLHLNGASCFKKINEINIGDNRDKLVKTFSHAYARAPYYKDVLPLIESVFYNQSNNLADFVTNSLVRINEYLEINTKMVRSSNLENANHGKGQERIIHLCKLLNANMYINPIGGKKLYDPELIEKNNLSISFLKSEATQYTQFKNEFIHDLSILDTLMFNSKAQVRTMLNQYTLE